MGEPPWNMHSFILFSNYELYCQHHFLIEKCTEISECLSSFLKSWIGFKLLDQLVYYVKMIFASIFVAFLHYKLSSAVLPSCKCSPQSFQVHVILHSLQSAGTVSVFAFICMMYFACLSRAVLLHWNKMNWYSLREICGFLHGFSRHKTICVSRHKTVFPSCLSCFISLQTWKFGGGVGGVDVLTSNRITCWMIQAHLGMVV